MVNKSTNTTSSKLRIVGLQPSTVAAFQATLFGLVGLFVGISYSLSSMLDFSSSTDSLLLVMAFGIAQGFFAVLLVPMIYAAFGWVVGYLQGWIANAILDGSGGIVLETRDK